jgi:isochorismate synthase
MREITITEKIREKEAIREVMTRAVQQGQSFSLWKTPGLDEKHLIVCNEPDEVIEFQLEDGEPGFAFASFLPDGKKFHFPSDVHYIFAGGSLIEGPALAGQEKNNIQEPPLPLIYHFRKSERQPLVEPENFIELVKAGLMEIESGKVEKLVPTQFKDFDLPAGFDLLNAFNALCEKHPQALVSLVSSPQTGTWLGATPELLVDVTRDNKFRTIALAGTQPYHDQTNLKAVAWTQKEIEEQALVCRYIINCFKKIRLREYEEHGPRTMVAGNVMHLKTDYEVDMGATNFPQLGTVMLKLLHPTSAVCGMPFDAALNFINQHEGYDREYYSGYLGPVQIKNESHIYVNLRCMQVFENHARLYAGAGVTIDSVPEKEWEEAEIKMQNMQNILYM